jgi:hypothetical protein
MCGLFGPAPMLEMTEARAVVRDHALYNVVDMQDGFLAGPACCIVWRPKWTPRPPPPPFSKENPHYTLYRSDGIGTYPTGSCCVTQWMPPPFS